MCSTYSLWHYGVFIFEIVPLLYVFPAWMEKNTNESIDSILILCIWWSQFQSMFWYLLVLKCSPCRMIVRNQFTFEIFISLRENIRWSVKSRFNLLPSIITVFISRKCLVQFTAKAVIVASFFTNGVTICNVCSEFTFNHSVWESNKHILN